MNTSTVNIINWVVGIVLLAVTVWVISRAWKAGQAG